MSLPIIRNPIRLFAVLCVAVTSGFVMWMIYTLIHILADPDWCSKALQAARISNQNFGGLTACTDLLKIQLEALARNSLVFGGVISLCLLTLIVIVIAGGKLDLKVKDIVEANMSRDAPAAAQTVADSAQETADVIKETSP